LDIIIYLLIGGFAGTASGLFGIGGGIIVVPALAYEFHLMPAVVEQGVAMHLAIGTSLAIMILTTYSSARAHNKRGSLIHSVWRKWLFSLPLGSVIGAVLASQLSSHWLATLFGIFLIPISIKMGAGRILPKIKIPQHTALLFALGVGIGVVSGLLGVGGGVLMVPLLVGMGYSMAQSAGTATASTVPIAIIGAFCFTLIGWHETRFLPWATGYIYWPAFLFMTPACVVMAPIGARLAHVLPHKLLRRVFAVFLMVVALKMLFV
jgi:uncharacterized protein